MNTIGTRHPDAHHLFPVAIVGSAAVLCTALLVHPAGLLSSEDDPAPPPAHHLVGGSTGVAPVPHCFAGSHHVPADLPERSCGGGR